MKTILITGGTRGIGLATALRFSENDWNVYITSRKDENLTEVLNNHPNLKGFVANADSEEAKEKYKDKYVFTPHRTSMYPFLTESTRRDLREKLYNSYVMRGDNNNETDNKKIAVQIAKLRAERANIMGYKSCLLYTSPSPRDRG